MPRSFMYDSPHMPKFQRLRHLQQQNPADVGVRGKADLTRISIDSYALDIKAIDALTHTKQQITQPDANGIESYAMISSSEQDESTDGEKGGGGG